MHIYKYIYKQAYNLHIIFTYLCLTITNITICYNKYNTTTI